MSLNPEVRALFSDFGCDALVGGALCRGIFEEPYAESFGVAGNGPALLVPDGISATENTLVLVGGRNFKVTGVEPDGTGFICLKLEAE